MLKHALAAITLATLGFTVSAGAPAIAQSTTAPAELARLNPNTATPAQLATVPHLTPALISAIQTKRPFKRTADFHAVLGASLKPEQLAETYAKLFAPIDLNTATPEEINLIPGMTRRMVHEFEEYRPYKNIEQFNKEIGKYVPPAEVARLRSYVTIN
jgi:DNA uptake protein ComE-like DNA-binding protein